MPGAKATLSSLDHNVSSIFDARVTKNRGHIEADSEPRRSRLSPNRQIQKFLKIEFFTLDLGTSEMASLQNTFQVKGETARRIHSVWYFIEAK